MSIIQEKLVVMMVMVLIGFLCGKLGLISSDTNKKLSNLSLLLINPLLIFVSYQTDFSFQIAWNLLKTLLLTLIAYGVQIGMAVLLIRKKGNSDMGVERMSLIFSNTGFIGIPLVESVFGAKGVIYLTVFITMFNILIWTYGVVLMTGKTSLRQVLKNLCSPAILTILIGLVFFFTGLRLPPILLEPLQSIGSMNTPFAMLIAGATLAGTDLAGCLRQPRRYLLSGAKLLLIPALTALTLFSAVRFGFDAMLVTIVIIAVSCPAAATTTMFAHRYGGNSSYASELFAMTTIFSAVTIPTVLWFLDVLLAL